jgi:hypothetical protein
VDLRLPVGIPDGEADAAGAPDLSDGPDAGPADATLETAADGGHEAADLPDAPADRPYDRPVIPPDAAPEAPPPDAPGDGLPSTLMGLVGYWKLDDRSSALVADSSPFGNDGTVMGMPALVAGAPKIAFSNGGAFSFGMANDAVVVPDQPGSTSLQPAQISISVWVKLASQSARSTCGSAPSTQQYIVHRRNTRGAQGNFEAFALFKEPSSNTFAFRLVTNDNQQDDAHGTLVTELDTWYHVVGTFDGGTVIRLYVNGSFDGQHSHPYPIDYDPTGLLFIARTGECAPNGEGDATWDARFNGVIDDLRIYNRVLTVDEITRLSLGME